jgi:hypothetical protein
MPTPPVGERADRLLARLSGPSKKLGAAVSVNLDEDRFWIAESWCADIDEVRYLILDFLGQAMHYTTSSGHNPLLVTVTPSGYARLDALRHVNTNSQMGFCAMAFAKRLDPFYDDAIAQGIRDAGYEPRRVDRHQHNKQITDEMLALIRQSRFIVADATLERPNVYFEAGFAQGLGLDVIWTCQKDAPRHFDVRQFKFLEWRPDAFPDLRRRLKERIEATIGRGTYDPTIGPLARISRTSSDD